MTGLHTAVINAFKNEGWAFEEVKGQTVIKAQFEAYHSKVPLHVQSFNEAQILNVVTTASVSAPHSHKSRAAELLMRVNKELNIGNFEMDWDNGQVMFRQAQVFSRNRYDESIIVSLVHNAIAEMDRITPYLSIVCKTAPTLLTMLNIPDLLLREDLLPPLPTETAS